MNHKEQQGFVTFAQNTKTVNYLDLAYLQCLNVKVTQKNNKYAVIVDAQTQATVEQKHKDTFDYIITISNDQNKINSQQKFANEYQVFSLTPFKETIKLESDLLFTRSIDHWWTAFRLKNICLSTGARNFRDVCSPVRKYRELFDENHLPDVYNGLMYFRYSQEAHDFFQAAQFIQQDWSRVRGSLKKCIEEEPSTVVLYALAALMIGEETCTMPSMDFLNLVHMKPGFNGWSDLYSWMETVMNERDGDMIRINNLNQYHPVHYHTKEYATQELIKYYESRVSS